MVIALVSLVAAPWGELLPEIAALGVSRLFGLVSDIFYPALSIISPDVAFIGSMFINVLLVVLVFLLLAFIARRSISGLKKLVEKVDQKIK
jgi:hypothetical protein